MACGSRKGAEKQKRFEVKKKEGGVMMRVTDSKTQIQIHIYIAPLHSYWAFS